MKISYIANIRIPTEKAHGIQIMKMCEAFARLGHEVELVVPRRKNKIMVDPFSFYQMRKMFTIRYIFSPGLARGSYLGFWSQAIIFSLATSLYQLFYPSNLIFSRDELPVFCLSFFRKNVIWEAHSERFNFFIKVLLDKIPVIVVITEGLKVFYSDHGVADEKIIVTHDSVDLEMFCIEGTKEDCRLKLGLPIEQELVIYTGHLYDWKGAQVLAEAALLFPPQRRAVFVGGTEEDLREFKIRNQENFHIMIVGHRPYREMPFWMKAANVLVLPNTSPRQTSPMKLFEYMASGVPIVASDLPTIREVLNKKNSFLVEPSNPKALQDGIDNIINSNILGQSLSCQALVDAKKNSWEKRAEKILTFVKYASTSTKF